MKRVYIIVTGKVQNVCFRLNTERIANKLGLKGTVRNLDNGKVEVVAEGEENKINDLILFCRKGTGSAKVDSISVDFEEPTGEFNDFVIKNEVEV